MSISLLRKFVLIVLEILQKKTQKTAVVLFNLGGPDSLEAVRPFLYNLFSDPAILTLPAPFRFPLAWFLSKRREEKAKGIYEKIGGQSPILVNTVYQKLALEESLQKEKPNDTWRVFVCMRYWHPRLSDVLEEINDFNPDQIVLLPLYPQFSTTTTGSSFTEWDQYTKGIKKETHHKITCYPDHPSFVEAHCHLIETAITEASHNGKFRLLFSAHGLPQKIIDKGDPYEKQVHQTVKAIMGRLNREIDFSVCYQSKVGPLKWLGPSTDEALKKAGSEKVSIVLVPITFVSEHSETLVELDLEYKELAEKVGIPGYFRVPALGTHPLFIKALSELVLSKIQEGNELK